jgi:hypothetical protein
MNIYVSYRTKCSTHNKDYNFTVPAVNYELEQGGAAAAAAAVVVK